GSRAALADARRESRAGARHGPPVGPARHGGLADRRDRDRADLYRLWGDLGRRRPQLVRLFRARLLSELLRRPARAQLAQPLQLRRRLRHGGGGVQQILAARRLRDPPSTERADRALWVLRLL